MIWHNWLAPGSIHANFKEYSFHHPPDATLEIALSTAGCTQSLSVNPECFRCSNQLSSMGLRLLLSSAFSLEKELK
ncbi:hypothetical protein AVDCRST_MAG92-212 [uncultured Coleofasciculus sp.]|uniref:Uncharacterized protein n=1 Tax=uncultured Coleofasciculus sp. TaxID=1267456 RepID=A0A6J4H681_9CYAN|nr:hypothetical protein AVDCRST_MAG92-212 [uncultured Coleofasciculus sp.]